MAQLPHNSLLLKISVNRQTHRSNLYSKLTISISPNKSKATGPSFVSHIQFFHRVTDNTWLARSDSPHSNVPTIHRSMESKHHLPPYDAPIGMTKMCDRIRDTLVTRYTLQRHWKCLRHSWHRQRPWLEQGRHVCGIRVDYIS